MTAEASTTEGGAVARLDLVLFRAGGFRVGVDAGQVRASRPVVGGRSDKTAPEIESRLGLPSSPLLSSLIGRQRLIFKGDVVDCAANVDGPMELVPMPLERIHPLPVLLAARHTLRGLRGLALDADGLVLLVDARELMADGAAGSGRPGGAESA